MKNWFLVVIIILLCFIRGSWAATELTPFALHDSLGTVIDSVENNQYKIFGPVPGFVQARMYKISGINYQLHIIVFQDSLYQLLTQRLYRRTMERITRPLNKRIESLYIEKKYRYLFQPKIDLISNQFFQYKLELTDGREINGYLEEMAQDTLILSVLNAGEIKILDSEILNATPIDEFGNNKRSWGIDPYPSQYLLAPTAWGLKSGDLVLKNYFLILPGLEYGLTDYFSLGGGLSVIPKENGLDYMLNGRVSLPLGSWARIGAGMAYIEANDDFDYYNLGYSVISVGDEQFSFSLGYGKQLNANSVKKQIYTASTSLQFTKSKVLIIESWIFEDTEKFDFWLYGCRFFGKHWTFDLGILSLVDAWEDGRWYPLPWLSYTCTLK